MQHVGAETNDSRQWLLTDDLPCLGEGRPECGYNLRGLVGPIVACPECGHHNDLRDASQWSKKKLPLGVRERQHWPATSAALSLVLGGAGLFAAMSGGAWVFVVVALLIAVAWVVNCWRWIKSCYRTGWALSVLTVLHVGAWSLMVGLGGPCIVLAEYREPIYFSLVIVGVVLGLVAFWWTYKQIKQGEAQAVFRHDWKRWRVPVVMHEQQPVE